MDFRRTGLEAPPIQLAAAVDAQPRPPDAPQRIAVIPVLPGDMVPLPFDGDMAARLGGNGNLAIKSGDLTIILQGYVAANLREPVTILAGDNETVDVAALLQATGPEIEIQTAIGAALDAPPIRSDRDASGNGIFVPFTAFGTLPPLDVAGTLDNTLPILGEPEIPLRAAPTPDILPALAGVETSISGNPPRADDLAAAAAEDGPPVSGNFAGDDPDLDDQGKLTFALLTQPAEGSATDNKNATFSFDPGADFQDLAEGETRDVTFQYTATDPSGLISPPATVTVTVSGVNDAPEVEDVSLGAKEDGPAVGDAFAGDDADSDDDPASLKYMITNQPGSGTVINNGDGTFTFDPGLAFQDLAEGETRDVTLAYTATDQHGAVSAPAIVTITVAGANDGPVVEDQALAAKEDGGPVSAAFKGDDADSDDDPASLKYTIITPSFPGQGTIIGNGDGTFTFDPGTDFQDLAEGATRDVIFKYAATDQHGAVSGEGTITVTVTGVNDAPIVQDIALKAEEDGTLVSAAFKGDDADDDDNPASLKYAITSQPAEGSVTDHGDGTFSFDPGADFQDLAEGEIRGVTFIYTATDSHGAVSTTATVIIAVVGTNDEPAADDLARSVKEEQTVTASFVADDIDSDDDPTTLSYAITLQPSAGTVTVNPDGTFTFDTGEDFDDLLVGQTRTVTFTYIATDNHGAASAPATVTITVTGANVIPVDPNACIPTADQLATYTYVAGTTGADTLNPGGNNSLWIQGFDGSDKLTGAGLADLLQGGEGNDTLDGGGGADAILGGLGNDTIKGGDANDCIGAGVGDDTVDGGNSNDNLRGDAGNDIITGGDGEDTVQGGDGNDKLSGNQGQDIVAGGEGDDTLSGNDGDDKVNGDGGNDQLTGDQGQDILTGDAGEDKMSGGDGDDQLDGGADSDTLAGDQGQDKLTGGDGDDKMSSGDGDDQLDAGIGNDTLAGDQGQDNLDGGTGDDLISGGTGDDKINGAAGNDKLFGQDNNDTIDGGAGDDLIEGEQGDDTILSGGGNDKIFGDEGNDTITLNGGASQIIAGQGDDRIDVGDGNHVMFYTSLSDGNDTIFNFDGNPTDGQDVFNLDPLFDALEASLGPLDAATRASMVELQVSGGQVAVFIDADNNDATGTIRIGTLNTTDAVTVGQDIVVT